MLPPVVLIENAMRSSTALCPSGHPRFFCAVTLSMNMDCYDQLPAREKGVACGLAN
jgi:hypothetical protein